MGGDIEQVIRQSDNINIITVDTIDSSLDGYSVPTFTSDTKSNETVHPGFVSSLLAITGYSVLNLLLLFSPAGFISFHSSSTESPLFSFICNLVALVPISNLLEFSVNEIKVLYPSNGATVFKAMLSNSPAILLLFTLLQFGQSSIAQLFILGLITFNLTFTLGSSLVSAKSRKSGWNSGMEGKMEYTKMSVHVCILFVCLIVILSLRAHASINNTTEVILPASRAIALIFLVVFGINLAFTRCTHSLSISQPRDEEDRQPMLSLPVAALLFVLTVILLGFHSDYLVRSIPGVLKETSLNSRLIGFILLPLGVSFLAVEAYPRIPEEAVDNCFDKGVVVVTYLAPLAVLFGWAFQKDMTLAFSLVETFIALAAVICAALLTQVKLTWLRGVLLISLYFVAVGLVIMKL